MDEVSREESMQEETRGAWEKAHSETAVGATRESAVG